MLSGCSTPQEREQEREGEMNRRVAEFGSAFVELGYLTNSDPWRKFVLWLTEQNDVEEVWRNLFLTSGQNWPRLSRFRTPAPVSRRDAKTCRASLFRRLLAGCACIPQTRITLGSSLLSMREIEMLLDTCDKVGRNSLPFYKTSAPSRGRSLSDDRYRRLAYL